MCCGEHRDKAVPFTVKTDLFEYLSTIGFEATIVIMEFDTCQPTDKPIEYPTGKLCAMGRGELVSTTHHVISRIQFLDETWDFFWIILEICIHGDDDFALACSEPGSKGCGLPKVSAEANRQRFLCLSAKVCMTDQDRSVEPSSTKMICIQFLLLACRKDSLV